MTTHVQFSINDEQAGGLCGKLKCRTDQLGQVLKYTLLNRRESPYFKIQLFKKENEIEDFLKSYKAIADIISSFNIGEQNELMNSVSIDPNANLEEALTAYLVELKT